MSLLRLDHVDVEQFKAGVDGAALGATAAALIGWAPGIAAALASVWWVIRIWEMCTVQKLFGRYDGKCINKGDDDDDE